MAAPPAVPSPPPPSPIEAAQQAFEHTRRQLFPFRFERWLALGFMAFLDQCGRGGGFGAFPGGYPGAPPVIGRSGSELGDLGGWVSAHLALLMGGLAVAMVVVAVVAALATWIGSRGVFMYLDNVATGRADVSRSWTEHAERASSYFVWSFGLVLAVLLGGFLLLACGGLAVLSAVRGGVTEAVVLGLAFALLAPLVVFVALGGIVGSLALRDFIAPLQMKAGVACGEAVKLFVPLLQAHPWTFVFYLILKIGFVIALGGVLALTACLTCCLGILPIVRQTLLQPAFYFERAWSLYFVRQLGYDLVGAGSKARPEGPR